MTEQARWESAPPETGLAAWSSPLLSRPGAVAADDADAGVAAHYGDPFREQRSLAAGSAVVDLSHYGIVRLTGSDRRKLLHSLSTQDFRGLVDGGSAELAILSPNGHVEHHAHAGDDGAAVYLVTGPGRGAALADFLDRMVFSLDVEVADVSEHRAVLWRSGTPDTPTEDPPTDGRATDGLPSVSTPRGWFELPDREGLSDRIAELGEAGVGLAGVEAYEALRIAAGEPRLDLDTDHRTIPNELGWIGTAVALDKGCYRGQETVARVHTLGRPPRRLTVLWVDGSPNVLPAHGDPVMYAGRQVGSIGSAARHFESGPLALALLKRTVPVEATLTISASIDLPATQQTMVDPAIGLHARHHLG